MLGNESPETSQPGEIVGHADWYDYEAKYTEGGMDLVVPAPIGEGAIERGRELAAQVFELAGCCGLARCDFFVEAGGEILVNEINTIPGFTETSVYAKLCEARASPTRVWSTAWSRLALERTASAARVLSADPQPKRRMSEISTPKPSLPVPAS